MPDDKPDDKPAAITTPGPSYTDWLATAGAPDREPHNSRCPKLGTRWVSADCSAWCKPIGWQGGYVWVECPWGTQLWAYDEFWSWVEETRSTAEPAPPETWHGRPPQL